MPTFRGSVFLNFFIHLGPPILHQKFWVISSKIEGMMAIFAILDFLEFFFQSLDMESHWGPKAPSVARGALGAQRVPSPPQEIEGRARSALNF